MIQISSTLAALLGALAFGAGDFFGGCATLKLRKMTALCLVQCVALGTSIAVVWLVDATVPVGSGRSLAALSGLFHLVGVAFLYQGFSIGRITIVAPISALFGLGAPVMADILFLRSVQPAHVIGIGLSIAAVVLISDATPVPGERGRTRQAIGCGFVSGLGYGFADVCLGLMTVATAEGGLMLARLTGTLLAVCLLLAGTITRYRAMSDIRIAAVTDSNGQVVVVLPATQDDDDRNRSGLALLLCSCAGLCDCLGQLGFVLAAVHGQMSTAASLIALYPAITVILGVWFLRERIRRTQGLGLLASMASLTLLAS